MPNSYTKLLYHIVCGTKGRRPLINDHWRGELDRYIGGLVREKGENCWRSAVCRIISTLRFVRVRMFPCRT
jgi:hypothetical protein